MKNTALIITSFLMVACTSTKTTTTVETKVTPTVELAQGKIHYQNQCANCHGLHNPTSKTAEQWKAIVPRMAEYINGDKKVMDDKTEASILNYLVLASTDK